MHMADMGGCVCARFPAVIETIRDRCSNLLMLNFTFTELTTVVVGYPERRMTMTPHHASGPVRRLDPDPRQAAIRE